MKEKTKRIHPCSQCIVLPMCTKECPDSYYHDLTVFASYSIFITKFSRRQEFKYGSGYVPYDIKLLNHFFKTADRKIKKNNKFLIEEVEEILSYRSYIRNRQKTINFTINYNYFAIQPFFKDIGSLLYNGSYS